MKTVKRLFVSFLVVLLVLTSVPLQKSDYDILATANDYKVENDFTYDTYSYNYMYGAEASIVDYSLTGNPDVIIPSQLGEYPLYAVKSEAFCLNTNITSLEIEESLSYIGTSAFSDCTKLKTVKLPHTLNKIDKDAFANCTNLKEVYMPNGADTIESGAFKNCSNLEIITLPDSISYISDDAFSNCSKLNIICSENTVAQVYAEKHNIPFSFSEISTSEESSSDLNYKYKDGEAIVTFCNYHCDNMLFIPSTYNGYPVTKIEANFLERYVKKLIIPDSVTSIESDLSSKYNYVTIYCNENSFAEKYAKENNIPYQYIDESPECFKLEKNGLFVYKTYQDKVLIADCSEGATGIINIPSTFRDLPVTGIENRAFYLNSIISEIILPESIVEIGSHAFLYCRKIKKIVIPPNVISIGEYAFDGCENLTIYGYSGSFTENYSKEKNIPFKAIDVEEHTHFFNSTITTPATCVADGIETFLCSCGESYTKPIEKLGHTPEIIKGTLATCQSTGLTDGEKCSVCGEILIEQEITEKGDHVVEIIKGVSATCTQTGLTDGEKCSVCGEILTEQKVVEKGEHVVEIIKGIPATCQSTGLTDGEKCSVCGEILTEQKIIPKLDHSYTSTITTPATCVADGIESLTCICGDSYTKVIAKLGHTPEIIKGKPASCSKTGLTDGEKCSVCGEILTEQTVIEKGDHVAEIIKGTPATCQSTGLTDGEKCSVCGEILVQQEVIEKVDHIYNTTTEKATLTSDGEIVKACTECGEIANTEIIPKPEQIELSTEKYTYNGKVRTPDVVVKDAEGNTLEKDTDYTVEYESGRKIPGVYTVTVIFIGNYSGEEELTFEIAPKTPTKLKATQTYNSVTLSWAKVTGATGYRVYRYVGGKWQKVKNTTSTNMKISDLKAGTNYYFKVIAYTKDDGKVIWGEATSSFKTATATVAPKISKITSSSKGTATIAWNNVSGESGYNIYYSTSKNGTYKKASNAKANATKTTVKKLKSGKTYYFKVRTYKTTANGYVYSNWSSVKSVKVK